MLETKLAAMGAALGVNEPLVILPADLLNLTNWKLTTPYKDMSTGNAEEILQPELSTFDDVQFRANPDGRGVLFRVNHGDSGTTPSSQNKRMELREMNGSALASWSPGKGTHLLSTSCSVPVLTDGLAVVLGQIHDKSDDIAVWRLEDGTLYRTNGNSSHDAVIAKGLPSGSVLNLSFLVSGGMIRTFYNGAAAPVPDLPVPAAAMGWYFKTGNYLQSAGKTTDPHAGATVIVYDVAVFHG